MDEQTIRQRISTQLVSVAIPIKLSPADSAQKGSIVSFVNNPKKCRSIIVLMTSRHFYILYYK